MIGHYNKYQKSKIAYKFIAYKLLIANVIIISILTFVSCDCPDNLEGPSETKPVSYSNLLIINTIENEIDISISNSSIIIIPDLNYGSNHIYSKVVSGPSSLQVFAASDLIMNIPINLIKNYYYTVIISGSIDSPQLSFVSDESLNTEKVRVIDLFFDNSYFIRFNNNNILPIQPKEFVLADIKSHTITSLSIDDEFGTQLVSFNDLLIPKGTRQMIVSDKKSKPVLILSN